VVQSLRRYDNRRDLFASLRAILRAFVPFVRMNQRGTRLRNKTVVAVGASANDKEAQLDDWVSAVRHCYSPFFISEPEGLECHIGVMRMVSNHAKKRIKKETRRKI
jgi:hypothetical protein